MSNPNVMIIGAAVGGVIGALMTLLGAVATTRPKESPQVCVQRSADSEYDAALVSWRFGDETLVMRMEGHSHIAGPGDFFINSRSVTKQEFIGRLVKYGFLGSEVPEKQP